MRGIVYRRSRSLLIVLALALACACAKAPPDLSPAGTAAFHATRVVKALDQFRDIATAANAETPPLISTVTTRQIVLYHRSAVTTIGATPSGWVATVQAGLDEVKDRLPSTERKLLDPYIVFVQTLIREVTRDR
jgi:hypothetical protein